VDVTVKAVTLKGVLLYNGHREAWVAKSEVLDSEDDLVKAAVTRVELPLWIAEKAGMV
jgi:hypothetical protein